MSSAAIDEEEAIIQEIPVVEERSVENGGPEASPSKTEEETTLTTTADAASASKEKAEKNDEKVEEPPQVEDYSDDDDALPPPPPPKNAAAAAASDDGNGGYESDHHDVDEKDENTKKEQDEEEDPQQGYSSVSSVTSDSGEGSHDKKKQEKKEKDDKKKESEGKKKSTAAPKLKIPVNRTGPVAAAPRPPPEPPAAPVLPIKRNIHHGPTAPVASLVTPHNIRVVAHIRPALNPSASSATSTDGGVPFRAKRHATVPDTAVLRIGAVETGQFHHYALDDVCWNCSPKDPQFGDMVQPDGRDTWAVIGKPLLAATTGKSARKDDPSTSSSTENGGAYPQAAVVVYGARQSGKSHVLFGAIAPPAPPPVAAVDDIPHDDPRSPFYFRTLNQKRQQHKAGKSGGAAAAGEKRASASGASGASDALKTAAEVLGESSADAVEPSDGLLVRYIQSLFTDPSCTGCTIHLAMLRLYQERLTDLLGDPKEAELINPHLFYVNKQQKGGGAGEDGGDAALDATTGALNASSTRGGLGLHYYALHGVRPREVRTVRDVKEAIVTARQQIQRTPVRTASVSGGGGSSGSKAAGSAAAAANPDDAVHLQSTAIVVVYVVPPQQQQQSSDAATPAAASTNANTAAASVAGVSQPPPPPPAVTTSSDVIEECSFLGDSTTSGSSMPTAATTTTTTTTASQQQKAATTAAASSSSSSSPRQGMPMQKIVFVDLPDLGLRGIKDKFANGALLALGSSLSDCVANARADYPEHRGLASVGPTHFRDSTLTKILKEVTYGPDTFTTVVGCLAAEIANAHTSHQTLRFLQQIKKQPVVTHGIDDFNRMAAAASGGEAKDVEDLDEMAPHVIEGSIIVMDSGDSTVGEGGGPSAAFDRCVRTAAVDKAKISNTAQREKNPQVFEHGLTNAHSANRKKEHNRLSKAEAQARLDTSNEETRAFAALMKQHVKELNVIASAARLPRIGGVAGGGSSARAGAGAGGGGANSGRVLQMTLPNAALVNALQQGGLGGAVNVQFEQHARVPAPRAAPQRPSNLTALSKEAHKKYDFRNENRNVDILSATNPSSGRRDRVITDLNSTATMGVSNATYAFVQQQDLNKKKQQQGQGQEAAATTTTTSTTMSKRDQIKAQLAQQQEDLESTARSEKLAGTLSGTTGSTTTKAAPPGGAKPDKASPRRVQGKS